MKKVIIAMMFLVIGLAGYSQKVAQEITQDSLKMKQNQTMGLNGHYAVITTTATTYIPLGWCVQVVEAAVIASLSYRDQADSLVTITASAGQCFYGKFKHIKLTSGKVIVYK